MVTSLFSLLFIPFFLACTTATTMSCDPSENPSSCPYNRRCQDNDEDGQYNCVCDNRFYTTNAEGNCVMGK